MLKTVGLITLLMQALASTPDDLSLSCQGGGIAKVQTGSSAYAFDNYGNSVTVTGRRANLIEYRSVADFRIRSGLAEIRLPRPLLPTLRGGKDGWFKVKNLSVNDESISGKAQVNFLNNPEFSINRYTGLLSVSSKKGSFSGDCEAFDESVERKF